MLKSPKVLVVSFDGGVWSNLLPFAEAGIMPNLRSLLGGGIYSNLESTIPPVTPPAWTSFMTGCNPGKTGVFDFYECEEGSYKLKLTSSKSIQVPTLWEILSKNNLRVGIIEVPINYPPKEVNGFLISGWERPNNKKVFTYPPELGTRLIEKLGDYPLCLTTFDRRGTKDLNYLSSLIEITSKVGEASHWLLKTEDTDFFMVHFQTTDIIQHGFWGEIMGFDFNSNDPKVKKIWEFYRNLDKYLGMLHTSLGQDNVFFLVSDHGFGPVKRRMATSVWLKENGYLKLKQDINTQIQTKLKTTAVKVFNRIDALARLKNRVKKNLEEQKEQRVLVPRLEYDPIDYSKTRAFSNIGTVFGTIHLNLIGREKEGIVPRRDAEALKSEIIEKLMNVRDPVSGAYFIKVVYRKEEIFSGGSLNKIPDLIIVPHDGYYLFNGIQEKDLFCAPDPLSVGNHIKDGIVLVSGKGSSNFDLSCARITDIAPTILNIFGLKVPEYMNGKSLLIAKDLKAAPISSQA